MQKSGYSLIEVFGVVALVLTLMVVAIPSLRNFQDGGKQGAAVRNASALNSAVQQFDQAGGLLTAQVHVPLDVGARTNPRELPEFAVLNLLRGDENGGQVSAWQEPVFDNKGYRVIWVNPLDSQQALREGLSGNRSELAEGLAEAGDGGRFEVIDSEGGRMGIVGFSRGDVDAALLVATTTFESPTPTPARTNGAPTASLTVNPPTAKVGEPFTYIANGFDPDNDPLSFTFTHNGGTSPTSDNRVLTRSYSAPGTYAVTVQVSDGSFISQAQASVNVTAVPGAPSVSLAVDIERPYRGQTVTYSATGTDPKGDSLSYRFIRDGAVVQEGTNSVYRTSYSDLGSKLVTVVTVNQSGLSNSADIMVNVTNRPPTVAIGVDPAEGYRGQRITFIASGSDPDGDALLYSFNNGAFSPEPTFGTSYNTVGTYTGSVVAKDTTGAPPDTSLTATVLVNIVNRLPSATIVGDKISGVRGEDFNFTATGSDPDGDAITYSFKVGPTGAWSEYGETNEFTHKFVGVGEMEVFAKVRDALGGESEETTPFRVTIINRAPTVTMTSTKPSEYEGVLLGFNALGSDPDGDSLLYSFNGGAFGASNEFATRFSVVGLQPVTVVAKDVFGALSPPFLLNVEILEANEFVFYWNQGVHTQDQNRVLTSVANAAQHSNFDAVMAAINSVGIDNVQNALAGAGAQQAIVGSRSVQSAETLTYGGGWVGGYSGGWAAHVGTYQEKSRTARRARGGGGQTRVRNVYTYHHYRDAYWHRTVTGTTTISEYQTRIFEGNSIVGVNTKTGQVVTVPASAWSNVVAGNMEIDGKNVNVAGYAGMTSEGEEFLARQYSTSRQWNEHYATTRQHYHTSYGYSGYWLHPVTISFTEGGDFLSGEWRKLDDRKPVESAKRNFNLDGEGAKDWEWVGPTEGILVVNEAKSPNFQPDGSHFFGHNTWGKKWANATDPMKTLDKNNDGFLTGSELDTVWVWVDSNSDAKVQDGELTTLPAKGITSVSVSNQEDEQGGEWFPGGATGPAGTFDMVDWWSVR